MPKSTKKQSMSQAFTALEEIVAEFEEGSLDLEESLPKFKEGLELAKFLKKRLKALENEIIEIQDQFEDAEEKMPEKEVDNLNEMEEELPF